MVQKAMLNRVGCQPLGGLLYAASIAQRIGPSVPAVGGGHGTHVLS